MNRSYFSKRVGLRAALGVSIVALMLALVITARAEPGNDNRAPVLVGDCAKLNVEEGNKVIAHGFAIGVQIYRWDGSAWIFVAPRATLYEDPDFHGEFAQHFGGPTWESNSGSSVVGTAVLQRCTPDPDSIPWLLLKGEGSGSGIFADVTFVQRVNTVGGKAPSEPGDFVGDEAEVPYTADYYFYRHQG